MGHKHMTQSSTGAAGLEALPVLCRPWSGLLLPLLETRARPPRPPRDPRPRSRPRPPRLPRPDPRLFPPIVCEARGDEEVDVDDDDADDADDEKKEEMEEDDEDDEKNEDIEDIEEEDDEDGAGAGSRSR